MVFRRAFDCLWCGRPWQVRAAEDLEGWAGLCPECLGKADGNDFLRMRLRAALRDRAAAAAPATATAGGSSAPGSPATEGAPPVVPGDWEDWYLRRGGFSRGPIHDGPWSMELEQVTGWLDESVSGGVIVELGAGMGWWTALLAERGELWLYDTDAASLDAARTRLMVHGLLAHLHERDPLATPDTSVDTVFAAYLLGAAGVTAALPVVRGWLKPGGSFLFVEAKGGPAARSIAGPGGPLQPLAPDILRTAILQAGFASVELDVTLSAFVFGRAVTPA